MKIPLTFLIAAIAVQSNAEIKTLLINGNQQYTEHQLRAGSNEVMRVLSWVAASTNVWLTFDLRDGADPKFIQVRWSSNLQPLVVRGPVTADIQWTGAPPGEVMYPSVCTIEITPADKQFPIDRTAMIPAGQGAQITLECSSNLITWSPTLPGAFTNNPSAKFFRIHAERVP